MQPQRDNFTPPPVQTSAPPQLYVQPPTTATPPKKRISIVWIVLAIIAVPLFGEQLLFPVRHSTFQSNGQEITPEEQHAVMQDIAAMTQGVRAGDPNSFDTDYQPQTDLGRQFQSLLRSAQATNTKYMEATKEARSPDFLSSRQLGSAQGRANARRIHAEYGKATAVFRSETSNYQQKLNAFVGQMTGQSSDRIDQFRAQDQEIAQLDNEEMKGIDSLLDFVDQAKPVYDSPNHKLRFFGSDAVAKYKSLWAEVAQSERTMNERRAQILQDRQAHLRQSMTSLQAAAR